MARFAKSLILGLVLLPSALMAQEFDIGVKVRPKAATIKPAPGKPSILGGTTAIPPLVPLEEVATDDAFASVGRGFDPITGRVLDIVCVEGTETDWTMPAGATKTKAHYDTATSDRSHQSVSSSAVSVSALIKVVSLGFGTSSSSSSMFNSVDQTGRLYSRIAVQGVERRNVKWSDRADWLLRNNLPEFLKQCGTRYVRAVYSGHLFDDTVTFRLRQDQEGAASANSLSLGVGKIFSASAAFADAQTKLDAIADTRVEHYGRGVLAVPPAPGANVGPVENEFAYYNTGFLTAVTANPTKGALPLWIEADRYVDKDMLPNRGRIPVWTDQIIAAVLGKTDVYNDLVTAISDLKYALTPGPIERLKFYDGVTADQARDKQKVAADMLAAFQKAVVRCQELSTAGVEIPSPGKYAVTECQQGLDDALTPTKVAAITLPRAYK